MSSIAELGGMVGGKTPSKANPGFWHNGTVPWVSPKDMKVFDLGRTEDTITEQAVLDARMPMLPPKSILMVTRSGILAHSFPVAITCVPVTINQDIKAFKPKSDVFDSRYMAYNLRAHGNLILGTCSKAGTTVSSVESNALERLPLPLAPLPEQKRIADKLDTVLARVDACLDRLDRVGPLIKRLRQSVLAAAISGRLTEDWRSLRQHQGAWKKCNLPALGELGRGKSKHRPRNDPRLYEGEYPFVQTGDVANAQEWITSHKQTYSNFGLQQSKLWPIKTLCITIAANIADTALLQYPACFPDSVVGFVADESKCLPQFVKWSIDIAKDSLERLASATAQKNINLGVLEDIEINVPSLEEQAEIIRRVEAFFSFADRIEARLHSAQTAAERLPPALLAKAFRGELVPQDPNDEPVAELLKRLEDGRERVVSEPKSSRSRPMSAASRDRDRELTAA
ncbi:restriction endonuclease subunit S [Ralstonia solanacearum]|uniref:restriction endonuclease subunit S n=1 Tax=Ralstonia solanacearum TaxID=305 RepID=UPI0013C34A4D|nr:restriction endonuclease subunit S [Ralstonia solanacearum]